MYLEPRVVSAKDSIWGAEAYFNKDSFDLALNGDGAVSGFLAVAEKYGNTPSGNMAQYYCGICYMKKVIWIMLLNTSKNTNLQLTNLQV